MNEAQIRIMQEGDIERVVELFSGTIDELHREESEKIRQSFKEPYKANRLMSRLEQKESLYLVAERGGKVVGFLLGWVTLGNSGNLHWLGVDASSRGQGIGTRMIEAAIAEFRQRECYQIELCAYSQEERSVRLFARLGFQERAQIEKGLFGMGLTYMVKSLKEVPAEVTTRKIVLIGNAGQGIKLMGEILGNILAKFQKEVSLNVIYPPTVRTGSIEAELIYSDGRIDVPFIDEADVLLQLAQAENYHCKAKKVIVEESIYHLVEADYPGNDLEKEQVSFERAAIETFGSPLFVNMLALGKMLSAIGINLEKVNFESLLPARNFSQNVEAIRYGYIDHSD